MDATEPAGPPHAPSRLPSTCGWVAMIVIVLVFLSAQVRSHKILDWDFRGAPAIGCIHITTPVVVHGGTRLLQPTRLQTTLRYDTAFHHSITGWALNLGFVASVLMVIYLLDRAIGARQYSLGGLIALMVAIAMFLGCYVATPKHNAAFLEEHQLLYSGGRSYVWLPE